MNAHFAVDHPPLIVDSFAGGGGASTGIEMALGRSPDIAINHNPAALALHAANHPDTLHLSENVWQVDPLDYVAGRHVGLAWFSPDCKHFSKAKGGKPVERNIRDLAWVVVLWAERARPDVILLENVEEFRDWGPLVERERDGKTVLMPDPDGRGQTFAKWCRKLRALGYRLQHRELRACDYGAPTIRKRLFLIARRDGLPIVWPKPTHYPPASRAEPAAAQPGAPAGRAKRRDARSGLRASPDRPDYSQATQPWRTAAEIIDWSLPCPSIFDTAPAIFEKHGLRAVRPLADATMSRVARGVDRYVLKAKRPFLVSVAHGYSGGRREYSVDEPHGVVTAGGISHAVVTPSVIKFQTGSTGHPVDEPLHTITANSFKKKPGGAAPLGIIAPSIVRTDMASAAARNGVHGPQEPIRTQATAGSFAVVAPVLSAYYGHGTGSDDRSASPADPLKTVVTENRHAVIAPILSYAQQGGANRSVEEPAHTITASAKDQNVLLAPTLVQTGYGEREGQAPRALDPQAPLGTVVAGGVKHAAVVSTLVGCGGRAGQSRPRGGDEPAATITAKADVCLVSAFVAQHNNDSRREGGVNPGRPADEPVSTITASPQQAVVAAFVSRQFGTSTGHAMDEPTHTATADVNKSVLVAPHLMTMRNAGKPFNGADEPAHTVTAGGAGLTVVAPFISKYYGVEQESGHDEPLHTATGRARFGHVEGELGWPPFTPEVAARAREVAAFLRAHGFWDEREFVTVDIDGETFTIVDIGMRMLTPRELFSAQGFPVDYIIDLEFNGKPLPKDAQISCCGNSVSPPMATALVSANCNHMARWMEAAE